MRRYQTSIKQIMQARKSYSDKNGGKEPIFLSDWDTDYNSIHIPNLEFDCKQVSDLHKYYFWTDEENYRTNIQSFFMDQFSQRVSKDSFTIGSNGTSSMMLALTALNEIGKHSALVLTPIYFSTLNLLDKLEFDVVEFHLSLHNNFSIDINELENTIIKNKIDTLIITNPPFGSGIEINIVTIEKISAICNTHSVCLLMDYVYGGMEWNVSNSINYIFQYQVYKAVTLTEQYIFIESISKRIFLNGAKFSLIFASPLFMRHILRLSVFMVGSMAFQQVNLIPQIYSSYSATSLTHLIIKNVDVANNRYKIAKTLLSDSPIRISNANCGYFALISLPKRIDMDDTSYAIDLLNRTGVLSTPHSRYLYTDDGFYSFRINLLLDKHKFIQGISRIRNLK